MAAIDEKLNKFEKIIEREAIDISEQIRDELRRESEERLTGAKEEIRKAAEQAYQKETLRAETERDSQISMAKMNARKNIMNVRETIIASAMAALTNRLETFTLSEAYREYLAANIAESLRGAGRSGDGEGGGDDQDFLLNAFVLCGDDHAGNARVDRETGELLAEWGQGELLGDGAEFEKRLIAVGDQFAAGAVDEWEFFDWAEVEGFHL